MIVLSCFVILLICSVCVMLTENIYIENIDAKSTGVCVWGGGGDKCTSEQGTYGAASVG